MAHIQKKTVVTETQHVPDVVEETTVVHHQPQTVVQQPAVVQQVPVVQQTPVVQHEVVEEDEVVERRETTLGAEIERLAG